MTDPQPIISTSDKGPIIVTTGGMRTEVRDWSEVGMAVAVLHQKIARLDESLAEARGTLAEMARQCQRAEGTVHQIEEIINARRP